MIKKIHLLVITFLFSISTNAQNTIEINCQNLFLSGTNLAWKQFGGDVGFGSNPNLTYFDNFFADVKATGGNSVRWWLHTDASFTPTFDTSGFCSGLHESLTNEVIIGQIEDVLDKAWENDIYVTISLFSFDLLQDASAKGWSNINYEGNIAFLQSPTNIQSYIDNALTPMVNSLKDHPALAFWEIFNEPEGMSNEFNGWTPIKIPMADIQMVVNKLTGAIHDADPNARVTNGTWSMKANTNVGGGNKNYYSDVELIAAGGVTNGTLDFYQVHYYSWQNASISPFHHPASYWQLDKPIMLGEFHATEAAAVIGDDSVYDWAYNNGYFGAWGWQYNETNLWNAIKPQITYMKTTNPTVVTIDKDACETASIDNYYQNTVSLFPNPATNSISIKGLNDKGNIKIYSILGKQLANQKLIQNQVNITHLPTGIYFIKISTDKGNTTKRLIKQ